MNVYRVEYTETTRRRTSVRAETPEEAEIEFKRRHDDGDVDGYEIDGGLDTETILVTKLGESL